MINNWEYQTFRRIIYNIILNSLWWFKGWIYLFHSIDIT